MKVSLIETKGDLLVVNAARCSFDKESSYEHLQDIQQCVTDKDGYCVEKGHITLQEKDKKLIHYLAKHEHWTPFAHPQEVFYITELHYTDIIDFFSQANLSGFEWTPIYQHNCWSNICMRGSLYAWLTNIQYLPLCVCDTLSKILKQKYPISYSALNPTLRQGDFDNNGQGEVSIFKDSDNDRLTSYTLRIEAPIFVKRQLETHRRGFVMTDIEDWSQNEVSRRYVSNEPVIYTPDKWRLQSKDKKQGSSDDTIDAIDTILTTNAYRHNTEMAIRYYERMNERGIAHEQSRMILPLGTYTTWWWTGSMKSWKRLFSLRFQDDVQSETKEVAHLCYDAIQESCSGPRIYRRVRVNHSN